LSIARKLMTWGEAIPRLVSKIEKILESPDLPEEHARATEQIADKIGTLFTAVRQAIDDGGYDGLIVSADRPREEIVAADAALDQMLRPTASS
jgi:hypothetical protein